MMSSTDPRVRVPLLASAIRQANPSHTSKLPFTSNLSEHPHRQPTILRRDHRSSIVLLPHLPSRYIYLQDKFHYGAMLNSRPRGKEVCISRVKDLSIYHHRLTPAYRIPDASPSYATVAARNQEKISKPSIARKTFCLVGYAGKAKAKVNVYATPCSPSLHCSQPY